MEFVCFAKIQAPIVNISWFEMGTSIMIIGIMTNGLLFSINIPETVENKRVPIPEEVGNILYRKIDRGGWFVICDNSSGEIYVSGSDHLLKRYEMPEQAYDKIDWWKPAKSPVEEHVDHSIATACWDINDETGFLVTGGKDGLIKLRNRSWVA